MTSPHPIDFATLVDYWLGELDEAAKARIEEHLLACDACGTRLDEVIALASGVREAFERGTVHSFLTPQFVQGLTERGLRVRRYHVPRGGSVNCTLTSEDQFLIAYMDAPLEGVSRLDAIEQGSTDEAHVFRDIPFDPRTGTVVLSSNTDTMRRMPAFCSRFRLVAVDGESERVIGDYTFNHTPTEPAPQA